MTSSPQTEQPFVLAKTEWDDHWAGVVLAQDATHRWIVLDYARNLRLVTVRHGDETGWDYGWCYPRDLTAIREALENFDPETQDEPLGWHKRPGSVSGPRRAPHRERNPQYNRPRCLHGAYIGSCTDAYCPDEKDLKT